MAQGVEPAFPENGNMGLNRSKTSRTVLIVEDMGPCATTLEIAFLAIPDIAISIASSGQEALELLRGAEGGKVCALVTDLNMSRVDGFELIEQVRADQRHGRLPVIVVSGDTDPHTPERLHRLGADAYFVKPYSPAQVRQKLEELINASPW